MALIQCPECNKEISDSTNTCPHCGFKLKSKRDNKKWLIPVIVGAVIVVVALVVTAIALSAKKDAQSAATTAPTVTQEQQTTIKVVLRDNGKFQETLEKKSEKSIQTMTDQYTAMSKEIGGTYEGYKKNADKVNAWYAFCETEAESFCNEASQYCYAYYQNIAKDGIQDNPTWTKAMEDGYTIWTREMEDYYKACTRLYESAFNDFDRVLTKAYDQAEYDQVYTVYSDLSDGYQSACSSLYDLYSQAYSDLYDFYQEVWNDYYNGQKDIVEAYEKIFAK